MVQSFVFCIQVFFFNEFFECFKFVSPAIFPKKIKRIKPFRRISQAQYQLRVGKILFDFPGGIFSEKIMRRKFSRDLPGLAMREIFFIDINIPFFPADEEITEKKRFFDPGHANLRMFAKALRDPRCSATPGADSYEM